MIADWGYDRRYLLLRQTKKISKYILNKKRQNPWKRRTIAFQMYSSRKVSNCSLLHHIFKNLDDIYINQLVENEAMIMAEDVLDTILQQAAKYEYEKYI